MSLRNAFRKFKGFTLIEMLLVMAIILLLISLLLPALQRGQQKVRQIRCTSNLHQDGLGFLSFAHSHDDRFPIQVSTNQGGSAEFVDAGNALRGRFFFSYKHFVPLASELQNPDILVCPTDTRAAATNFSSLSNSNLSYFAALRPVFGNSDSILAGDRNLDVSTNTIARVGPTRPLRWTREMHQYRGNVLFADGHVAQQADVLNARQEPGGPMASLVFPDVPPPAAPASANPVSDAGGGGGGATGGGTPVSGGNLKANFTANNANAALTNGSTITNLQITSGPRNTPRSAFVSPAPLGPKDKLPIPDFAAQTNVPAQAQSNAIATISGPERTDEQQLQDAHTQMAQTGQELGSKAAKLTWIFPWWVIVTVLLGCLWLLKRARDGRTPRSRSTSASASAAPSFYYSKDKRD